MQQRMEQCMFHNWHPQFRKVTFKSEIIPLSEEFIKYLGEDGIYMPESAFPKFKKDETYEGGDTNWDEENGDTEEAANLPNFHELEEKIKQVIKKFQGAVFPKLNWSSPKDATWMSVTGNLKCQTPHDIFLLLKSSDFIVHDLSLLPLDKYVLVLRKWYDLNLSMEFRCFVKNHKLVAISQRDYTTFYRFLLEMKFTLQEDIIEFFETEISGKFPAADYTFDVFVTKQERVWLVDFNPWEDITESLLFDWDELNYLENDKEEEKKQEGKIGDEQDEKKEEEQAEKVEKEGGKGEEVEDVYPIFRIVESQGAIRPTLAMTNRLPSDLADLSNSATIEDLYRNFNTHNNPS